MKVFYKTLVAISVFVTLQANAVTVIVHPSNNASINSKSVKKIFLGKSKKFPGGGQAIPLELGDGNTRGEFLKSVVGKSESQYKAYWSKLVFTGKGQAPRTIDSEAEIIELISKNPALIGYVSDGAVTGDVKSVGKF